MKKRSPPLPQPEAGSEIEELDRQLAGERAARLARGRWGCWRVADGQLTTARFPGYEVPVGRLRADGLPAWLAHFRQKDWLERGDVEDLMACFDDLVGPGWLTADPDEYKGGSDGKDED